MLFGGFSEMIQFVIVQIIIVDYAFMTIRHNISYDIYGVCCRCQFYTCPIANLVNITIFYSSVWVVIKYMQPKC